MAPVWLATGGQRQWPRGEVCRAAGGADANGWARGPSDGTNPVRVDFPGRGCSEKGGG